MSEDDNQLPSALVPVGTKALAGRSETLIKRGLALAKSLQADDATVHAKICVWLLEKGDVDGAVTELHRIIDLEPDYAYFHFMLGFVLANKGDVDGAVAEYREALRLDPDDALAHYSLGVALYKKGDLDGAIAEYRTAIRLRPDDAGFHTKLGDVLKDKGNEDGAFAEYCTAVYLAENRTAIRPKPESEKPPKLSPEQWESFVDWCRKTYPGKVAEEKEEVKGEARKLDEKPKQRD